jgi:hypothetical protein
MTAPHSSRFMRSSRSSRPSVLALLVAGLLVLTGCAVIPRQGPVEQGESVQEDTDPGFLFVPKGPEQDADQQAILEGFVEAASSPLNNYEIAREFLAPGAKVDWNPDASVTVDEQSKRLYSAVDERTIALTTTATADVSAAGEYREASSSEPVSRSYHFTEVNGQWRLSEVPDGIVLERSKFDSVFSAHALSFFDPSWTYLVPDLRWFPSRASTGTRIVTALLDGPSEWLQQAVVTAFPEGTALSKDSVPLRGTTAEIDLNREALQAETIALQRMQAQVTASLTGVSSITAVQISIAGTVEEIPTLTVATPRVDSRALVFDGKTFGFQNASAIQRIEGLSTQIEGVNPKAATVNAAQTQAAVLTAGGVASVRSGASSPTMVDERANLIAPALDNFGYVWTVPADRPGDVHAIAADGTQTPVVTSWPEASQIVSLQVSRDGTRVLALLRSGGQNRLLVAGIERNNANLPLTLGEPVELTIGSGTAIGATWVDSVSVASVTAGEGDERTVVQQAVRGQSEQLPSSEGAVAVAGGNTARQLRTLDADGELSIFQGSSWQQVADGIRFVATQMGSPD